MQIQPTPADCCTSCTDPIVENIPGPQGEQGEPGQDGCTGTNAWTLTTDSFVMPAVGGNVTVDVGQSVAFSVGQPLFVETAGTLRVTSKPSATELELFNLGYDENAPPTTNIAMGVRISPGGFRGDDGSSAAGDLLSVNNLSDVSDPDTSLANLGGTTVGVNFFKLTNPGAVTFPRIDAANTVTPRSAADYRSDLSLVPGTNVQAFDALLTAIAALVTVADRVPYFTGVDTVAMATFTAYARTLVDDADAATARGTLGKVLPMYGLLGSVTAMNLNSAATDNAVTIEATRYRIDRVTMDNASTNLTTATAGVFTGAAASGTVIAADQALTALTAASKFDDLTLDGGIATDVLTATTVYARCGTAQGGAATANVHIFGWRLE